MLENRFVWGREGHIRGPWHGSIPSSLKRPGCYRILQRCHSVLVRETKVQSLFPIRATPEAQAKVVSSLLSIVL